MSEIRVQYCEYSLNKKSDNIYDLVGNKKRTDIHFIRVELPKEEFLKNQRAKYVIQSFKGKEKILFTGLIPLGQNFYYGDNVHSNGKKDLIIVFYNKRRKSNLQVFTFKNRNPRNKINFINMFFEHMIRMELLLHTF
ncbi:hypothetical protein [Epilithonimonas sp.]|uniref:hypothetical protein n=1 Tax=Epilithonimonas sp. TaxID=2894511 RepID=UPI00289CDD86|nr:hypothetical protein [Epilithonimonas sp.]